MAPHTHTWPLSTLKRMKVVTSISTDHHICRSKTRPGRGTGELLGPRSSLGLPDWQLSMSFGPSGTQFPLLLRQPLQACAPWWVGRLQLPPRAWAGDATSSFKEQTKSHFWERPTAGG